MQLAMEIDNSRKRSRSDDYEEEDAHIAKKTRQLATFASARDSAPGTSSDSDSESPASSPASMDLDDGPDAYFARPAPAPASASQPRGAILISSWNQARRNEDLRQSYPWLYTGRQVGIRGLTLSRAILLTEDPHRSDRHVDAVSTQSNNKRGLIGIPVSGGAHTISPCSNFFMYHHCFHLFFVFF